MYKGNGCDACFNTGYSGRTGVFEILGMTDPMRDAILSGKSHNEIVELASSQGVRRLEDSAKKKVREGTTSIEEIHRVLTTFA